MEIKMSFPNREALFVLSGSAGDVTARSVKACTLLNHNAFVRLSSMFTATVSCADSFCLLLRDREGLIGLGRNDPPGIS